MTADNDLEWSQPVDDPTRYEKPTRLCKHPRWKRENRDGVTVCTSCSRELDPLRLARGRSSRRLGGDQERRIERLYGPRKVGEFGDAIDHLGRDFCWQSKASRGMPPQWLARIHEPDFLGAVPKTVADPWRRMVPIAGVRAPLVIRSYVRQGVRTRDWIFVRNVDWWRLHGKSGLPIHGYVVMSGEAFLELHGRDAE